MYFKILRQFTKETQSQFHQSHQKLIFLSKFCIGMSGLTFADGSCSALSVSPCVIGSSTTLQFLCTQAFRHEIFQLSQCQYTCVRGHLHIESSHSFNENDAKFQTPPIYLSRKSAKSVKKSMFITSDIKNCRNFNEAYLYFTQVHK